MSTGQASTAQGDDYVRRLRRQVEHTIEQLAALSGSTLPPGEGRLQRQSKTKRYGSERLRVFGNT